MNPRWSLFFLSFRRNNRHLRQWIQKRRKNVQQQHQRDENKIILRQRPHRTVQVNHSSLWKMRNTMFGSQRHSSGNFAINRRCILTHPRHRTLFQNDPFPRLVRIQLNRPRWFALQHLRSLVTITNRRWVYNFQHNSLLNTIRLLQPTLTDPRWIFPMSWEDSIQRITHDPCRICQRRCQLTIK